MIGGVLRGNIALVLLGITLVIIGVGFAVGTTAGTATSGEPDPEIVDVSISDDEIQQGESVLVEVEAINQGDTAGTDSTISLMFPELSDSGDTDYVTIESKSISHGYSGKYESGDRLWDEEGEEIEADYVLVEAGTGTDPGEDEWPAGQLRRMIIEVTPQETGSFDIYVRSTMTDRTSDSDRFSYPTNSPTIDHQGYPVIEHTVDVVENTDGCLYVFVRDEDGDGTTATISVNEISGSFSELKHTAESYENSCNDVNDDTGVAFETPGGPHHLYLFDQWNSDYSWGVFEIDVPEDNERDIILERGGVYTISDSIEPRDHSELYKTSSEMSADLSVINGQEKDGANAEVEFYVYEEGESRPTHPSETKTVTNLHSGQDRQLTQTLETPSTEGEYKVEAIINTEYDMIDYNQKTDSVDLGTIDVIDPTLPSVTSKYPDASSVSMGDSNTSLFSVDAEDEYIPSDDLDITWKVEDEKVGTGSEFEFDASQYNVGHYDISAVVSDGITSTEDVEETWSVNVLKPASIDDIQVSDRSPSVGENVTFDADVSEPSGRSADLSYQWQIGEDKYSGQEVTVPLNNAGTNDAILTVQDEYGLTDSSTETINVENKPPEVTVVGPESDSVESPTGTKTTFEIKVENQDEGSTKIEFETADERQQKEEVIQGTDVFGFKHEYDQPGEYPVSIEVTDEMGETDRATWTAKVGSDPNIASISPDATSLNLLSGEEAEFSVDASDRDELDLSYNWYIGDERITTEEKLEYQFNESGLYDVQLEVENELGYTSTKSWEVDVDSFRLSPDFEDHTQRSAIDIDEGQNLVETVVSNPGSNDRAVEVELHTRLPDGVSASQVSNVEQGSPSQYTLSEILEPGESTNVQLRVDVEDDNLLGESESIEYEVRYHPVGVPDDINVVKQESGNVEFYDPNEIQEQSDNIDDEARDNQTYTGSAAESDDTVDDGAPGFTIITGIFAIGVLAILNQVVRRTHQVSVVGTRALLN